MINPDTLEDFHAWLFQLAGLPGEDADWVLDLVQDYIITTHKGDKNNG